MKEVVLERPKGKVWTYEDYLSGRIPAEVSEIVKGKEVRKMPTGGLHGVVVGAIYRFLHERLGERFHIFVGEVGLLLSRDPLTLRAGDIVVVSRRRLKDVPEGAIAIPPDLVVEVVSPHDSAEYVQRKVRDYKGWGVRIQMWVYPKLQEIVLIRGESMEVFDVNDEVALLEDVRFRLRDLLKEVEDERSGA